MAIFSALAIFLGAFLLFLVQPILGKMILPWFGGTPAVWTTCMLFFQVLLLGGYAYAALLTQRFKPRGQAIVHALLLLAAACLLPITPSETWKPADGEMPTQRILVMLLACVGLPYFLLSATSPLVQTWFAHAHPGRSPYRLYALSNVGSLGALLLYPLAIEPMIGTVAQGRMWSIGFMLFAAVAIGMAWYLQRLTPAPLSNSATEAVATPSNDPASRQIPSRIHWLDRATWFVLPALASMMLLAVTNHLCQDVAVVPFLWIAPLSLYLLSLIICFDADRWYRPAWFASLAIAIILFVCWISYSAYRYRNSDSQPDWLTSVRYDIRLLLTIYLSLFFFCCMLCHGEVVRRRPGPRQLTSFYLSISAGGALGGFFVAIVCPQIFVTFAELKIGIALTFVLAMSVLLRQWGLFRKLYGDGHVRAISIEPAASSSMEQSQVDPTPARPPASAGRTRWLAYALGVLGLALIGVVLSAQTLVYEPSRSAGPKIQLRNFYGAVTVRDWYAESDPLWGRALYNGTILHGYQLLGQGQELTPTTYYTESSGVGLALRALREDGPIKVGAVGLGAGTVAAYGEPGDVYRFYEINPLIVDLAQTKFSFLSKTQAETQVVLGDARLSLEREPTQGYNALILDAFSGDSIPVHLLTREALVDYWRHLKADGVLVVHVSNRYVNLQPVVNRLAMEFGLHVASIYSGESEGLHISTSEWMVLAKDEQVLQHPALVIYQTDPSSDSGFSLWTDDYNNIVEILRTP